MRSAAERYGRGLARGRCVAASVGVGDEGGTKRMWRLFSRTGSAGWRVPWRLGIAEDGGEALGYLIMIGVIIFVVGAIIAAILSVGLFLLGGLAIIGTSIGLIVALKDFFATLIEAHKTIR